MPFPEARHPSKIKARIRSRVEKWKNKLYHKMSILPKRTPRSKKGHLDIEQAEGFQDGEELDKEMSSSQDRV
ncbi:hypothetical protein ACHWQZ_G013400 [Mnemiopsis leidyi]